jgi:hypothetical protein
VFTNESRKKQLEYERRYIFHLNTFIFAFLAIGEKNGDPQNWLLKQDLDKLNPAELTPITDEVTTLILFDKSSTNFRSSVDRPLSTSVQLGT